MSETLSDKIQKMVHIIGMNIAEEEQNAILQKYGLTSLDKKQIQGVADLISYVNQCHIKQTNDFLKELKEEIQKQSLSDEIANTMAGSDECPIHTISPLECSDIINTLALKHFGKKIVEIKDE